MNENQKSAIQTTVARISSWKQLAQRQAASSENSDDRFRAENQVVRFDAVLTLLSTNFPVDGDVREGRKVDRVGHYEHSRPFDGVDSI